MSEVYLRKEVKVMRDVLKRLLSACLLTVVGGAFVVAGPQSSKPAVPSGVVAGLARGGALPVPNPQAIAINSIDFDAPLLFSQTLPLEGEYVRPDERTDAVFASGNGAILNVSSFDVAGYSAPDALAWNCGALNADGTVPCLPEFIVFPQLKQHVAMRVGSGLSTGQIAVLLAFDDDRNFLGFDAVSVGQGVRQLMIDLPQPSIRFVILDGPSILIADDMQFQ